MQFIKCYRLSYIPRWTKKYCNETWSSNWNPGVKITKIILIM